nr:KH homology domain-containing protein 4-like isoform X5 [Neodiprion pinetum]
MHQDLNCHTRLKCGLNSFPEMTAAAYATAGVDSVVMAKEKIRSSDFSNKISANGGFKGQEMYTTEFEINEAPPSARTLLTKGYVQEEINSFSGAIVSTRGRFMTEQEKICSNQRSLYLHIQGHTKHNIDLAIQKIGEIIKTEHQSFLNRPSRFTNAPPPLMSLHSAVPTVEKMCVGIENAPPGFDLRGRIIGVGGSNLLYIRGETGATVTLRGRGSQFIDPVLSVESPEPLHLYIEHSKPVALQNAKQLAINLIQTMQSELLSYIQQQPPPVQTQQVIEQPHVHQIQQAQFQTMNIGTLGQPNVVTIQHQDIIQHPQSSVMTLPATILTATLAGAPGGGVGVPPPGVHIPAHSGPLETSDQPQVQLPPANLPMHCVPPPQVQAQIQYHTQQIQYQNGHMQAQVHYTIQSPPMQQLLDQKFNSFQQNQHGVKRRYSDGELSQESSQPYGSQCVQRHGTGESDRQHQFSVGPPPGGIGSANGGRNKLLIPSSHSGEKRCGDKHVIKQGNEQNYAAAESGGMIPVRPPPQAPWQPYMRTQWGRPLLPSRDGEHHVFYPAPPPINMPPPQIRPLRNQPDDSRSPQGHQNVGTDHLSIPEYHPVRHYTTKPPPYNSVPLMQSVCNPPPPPLLQQQGQQQVQHTQPYQVPISQSYQPSISCPPWVNQGHEGAQS